MELYVCVKHNEFDTLTAYNRMWHYYELLGMMFEKIIIYTIHNL